ncbi:MAG: pitrilysin family protein [Methylacidiphilales bacterium]|nr:pitrilysin family protein [Candidatus Methylacidiphilales bacterium]
MSSERVYSKNLTNGLKVLVKVDQRSPLVTHQVWYHIGSADETPGTTGKTHLLEHLMFKGTKKYPKESISKTVSKLGGNDNAFTSSDYTAYFQNIPKEHLATMMEIEADRMANLKISKKEFEKELQVVREERRLRVSDNPQSKLYENFLSAAFANSGYKIPVIGWDEDLISLRVEDVQSWYDQWYAPNNATLVVVGDVIPKEVFALAQKYYGKVKPKHGIRRQRPIEPPLKHSVHIDMKAENVSPLVIVGYHVPGYLASKEESLALAMLSMAFANGESDWLYRTLVLEEKLALTVEAHYELEDRGTTLFTINAAPTPGVSLVTLRDRIKTLVSQIPDSLFSSQTRNKIKNQLRSAKVFARDSIFYQAMQLGVPESVQIAWDEYASIENAIEAISEETLRVTAKKWFQIDATVTATLNPQ